MVPRGSGDNPYLDQLAGGLSKRGHSVHIGSGRPYETFKYIFKQGVPDVIHIHWLSSFLISDNIFVTLIKSLITAIGLTIAKIGGIRIVWTAHNLFEHERRHPYFEKIAKSLLIKFVIDEVIVHGKTAKEELVRDFFLMSGSNECIYQVPHGSYSEYYPHDLSRESARELLGFEDERVYLYFGLIRRYKGVEQLAEVFTNIDGEENRLLIVGQPASGELREQIKKSSENDERIQTIFKFIDDDQIQKYMHAADVVVLPFRSITTSGSVILAMSFGKAVIAPNSGCIPDILPPSGRILYKPNKDEALKEALEEAKSLDLESMGRVNKEAVKKLDWDSIAAKTEAIYSTD